jgi:hypothetical protein
MASMLGVWTACPSRKEPYSSAAQLRLLATLAPMLEESTAVQATQTVLFAFWRPGERCAEPAKQANPLDECAAQRRMLPDDYLAREAVARALRALAPRLAAHTPERNMALCVAKTGLAWTGSREEAAAWAGAVAALLPADRDAFTSGVVEVLKYPTATGVPTELLLAALAKRWPDEDALRGKQELDPAVLTWLEKQPGRLLAKQVVPPVSPDAVNAPATREGG